MQRGWWHGTEGEYRLPGTAVLRCASWLDPGAWATTCCSAHLASPKPQVSPVPSPNTLLAARACTPNGRARCRCALAPWSTFIFLTTITLSGNPTMILRRGPACLTDELRANVLNGVLQLHLLGDRHAVVHDPRRPVLALQHHVATLPCKNVCLQLAPCAPVLAGQYGSKCAPVPSRLEGGGFV